jgi:hypothetical protein
MQPADEASFVASIRTRVLTVESLCDRQTWDLPPGLVGLRSRVPGDEGAEDVRHASERVTITLLPGALVRVVSTGTAGGLRLTVGKTDNAMGLCRDSDEIDQASVDGRDVTYDTVGLTYVSSQQSGSAGTVMLPVTGRIIAGEPVQQGGGWTAMSGVLLSGTVDSRIVPWWHSNPETVGSESVPAGGLFDTHPCLARSTKGPLGERCPGNRAKPAAGVVQTSADGDFTVLLDAHHTVAMTTLSVSCNATWPDAAWMARTDFEAAGEFRVRRHDPSGRERLLRLQYGGGQRHELELAPLDKLTITESDSGSFVELGGRLAGMVQQVNLDRDRVIMLRFDHIDHLIGDRFRTRGVGLPLAYEGVYQAGRPHAQWTTFLGAWLNEKLGGRSIVDLSTSTPVVGAPGGGFGEPLEASCRIKVDVIAWERANVPNPAWANVQANLKACGEKGRLKQLLCAAARSAADTTPQRVTQHKVTFNALVTPRAGKPVSKLLTRTIIPASGPARGQTEFDVVVVQNTVGPTVKDLLEDASCK